MLYKTVGIQFQRVDPPHSITFQEDITPQEFEDISQCKEKYLLALALEEKLALLLENFIEYENELLSLAQGYMIWRQTELQPTMKDRLALDRRIVNVLTACRLFIDHTAHTVPQLFGEESAEPQLLAGLKNHFYDSTFGYRLMEAVRNYVQHRGLLVNKIRYNMDSVEQKGAIWQQYTVAPVVNVAELANDPKFKKQILNELSAIGQEYDLRLAIREYVACLASMQAVIRDWITQCFSSHLERYRGFAARFSERNSIPIVNPEMVEIDESGRYIQRCAIVTDFLDLHASLAERNSKVWVLTRVYAANCAAQVGRFESAGGAPT